MAMKASVPAPGRLPTRRAFLQGAALIGVAAAACRPLGSPAPAAPQAVSFPAEMTWMPWSAANEWLAPTYQQVADAFSQRHPGTKLTILAVPTDWLVKLKTMIAAGTPPDVSDVHHNGQVRDLGTSGQVMDLTPFLKRDPYPKAYMGWEPWAWLKKQYGIPWALQSTAIFYNKQLFDAAGVRYPTDTWTWDDFVEAAKRLTKPGADDNSTTWGAGDQGGTNYQWINALLVAFGGGALSSDYAECTLTTPASLAGLEFRAGWGSKLRIARNVTGGTSGQFTSGNIAMVTSGSWFVANVKQSSQSRLVTSNIPWDVAPVPKGRARRAALAYELGVGIPAGVRSPDASWAVIRYLTSSEALVPFARIGRILPPDRGLWNETIPADGQPAGFKHAFLDFWDEINIVPPFVPRWPDVDAMWQDELNPVWTGDRPPKDGAAAFKTRMDQHLAQLKRDGLL